MDPKPLNPRRRPMKPLTPERDKRRQERIRRIAKWNRPLDRWPDRLGAWLSMLFVDHGVLRLFWKNRHQISPQMWRSNQPTPGDIAWAAQAGIRTVIYLRGGHDFGSWALEKEACARHGLALVELPFFSRALPTRERIAEADRMFADIAYPALLHCKSGADRAGFVAALYLVLAENRPVEEALNQLSLRYGHYRKSPTGVLDLFFEAYLADTRDTPMDFRNWVETRYDPAAIEARFKPSSLGTLLVDTVLRRE